MTIRTPAEHLAAPPDLARQRRWIALAAVATAQLMVGLDLTIMNIALPSAQRSLGIAPADRQWVITSFALAYGSLLLLGGRLGDLLGRRRALLIGIAGFGLASAIGGAAADPGMLFAARAAQGAFGALMTPSVLATLAVSFPVPAERAKAFGIYGTVMGSSSGLGVLVGGVLTQYLDWRWCMFVNLPIAAAAALAVRHAVHGSAARTRRRLDAIGAALVTGGLLGLVFGFARAQTAGWSAASTLGSLAAGMALTTAFVVHQGRTDAPLLPLRVVLDRRRGGAYLSVLVLAVGMFAALFFLTYYLQDVRGYSPVRAGLAFLPLTVGLMTGVRAVAPLLSRTSAVTLLPLGLAAITGALALLAILGEHSDYWTQVLPVFVLLGLGTGWVLITANSTATLDAGPDTAVAGATVMTMQQIGASLGTAVLSTIAGTAARHYLSAHHAGATAASVHGFQVASTVAAGSVAAGAVAVWLILPRRLSVSRRSR